MSFNTFPFLIFCFSFFLFWPILKKKNQARYLYLIVASFIFYGWWDWRFLFLIIFSGILDFFAAILIKRYKRKAKIFLLASIAGNLLCLGLFKYSGFFAIQIEKALSIFNIEIDLVSNLPSFTLILPIGISFYTFQSMSYTIDVYRNKLNPTNNILHFFAYLAMFPQLVAGPIIRASDFISQLKQVKRLRGFEVWNGMKLIIIGYFQKTVLADNLAIFVNEAFAGINNSYGLYWWIVAVCFAFQIYFDFNGYSQIARGLAKLMGYHFKINFNNPYLAHSLKDFWNRWHISLSTWFRDYVYIPLGGSKQGGFRSHFNMWITMGLSGMWHGASLNFVIWGLYHALALSIERITTNRLKIKRTKFFDVFGWAKTFIQVLIGWIVFRSDTFQQSLNIFTQMFKLDFSLHFIEQYEDTMLILAISSVYILCLYVFSGKIVFKRNRKLHYIEGVLYAFLLAAIIFFRGPEQEFIYFQF